MARLQCFSVAITRRANVKRVYEPRIKSSRDKCFERHSFKAFDLN
jgi:hypothetical protein